MGNTEDKKDIELKKIPRNPNIPIKDEEVNALLKEAAKQISEKEKSAGVQSSDKNVGAKTENKQENQKSSASKDLKTVPEFKKKETTDAKRENFDLNKSAGKDSKQGTKYSDKKPQEIGNKVTGGNKVDKSHRDNASKKSTSDATKSDAGKKESLAGENKNPKSFDVVQKDSKNTAKTSQGHKEFKVEDDVYVTKKPSKVDKDSEKSYKMSVGDIIGAVFEGIWTGIKLLVLVAIATGIVGFFMSRDLMIRGRSGEQISKQNMNVAAGTLSTKLEEREAGKEWNEDVEKEKITLEADDGKILVAQKVVVNEKNDNWVVILHGQNGTIEDIYDMGHHYASAGYNVLMPDLRAHGESEGSYFGMGWLDRLDVINWVDVILEENASANVIIHGVDLGADTALMLSGEPLKDSIKVIIAEGAYTSAWDAVKMEYKARHEDWPTFPMMHMLNPVAKVWGGYSLTEANAVEQVKKTSVPILLIHGGNDTYVTADMTEELNQAIASEHEVLTIATGTHEDCRFAEPDTYYNKVFEFVEKYVK